ncbi:RNA polymerase sigma factor [Sphingomonas sp. S-NIH.Pt1_0416]|uniref:RNA polymerase sigma factor n=1 Tax=Sphingomonas sp. S-NIH.Pt1_0416 TaxID=1920123 RepID=UPI000F7F1035|nr:sigma-70 family RNA polymerase sigma factor [Sphingomonas sp. S-NIH.Pt1_0416]RSU65265.1 RNA polymerase sigma factor [Sphingomonas sp. S-NIH.Pt1_0416]
MSAAGSPSVSSGLVQIYTELRGDLLRFLVARLGDSGEAEEVVQDLYLRIHALADGPVANGRAYLYRAAQNLALDKVRERRRRSARDGAWLGLNHPASQGIEPADPATDAETLLVEREQAALLASAIAALPQGAGRVFRLHKIDGVPHAAIAEQLGISRSGVEKHLAVAMAHLRRTLAD